MTLQRHADCETRSCGIIHGQDHRATAGDDAAGRLRLPVRKRRPALFARAAELRSGASLDLSGLAVDAGASGEGTRQITADHAEPTGMSNSRSAAEVVQ